MMNISEQSPLIQSFSKAKGDTLEMVFEHCRIAIIRNGKIKCGLCGYKDKVVEHNDFFLIPSGYKVFFLFLTDCDLMFIPVTEKPFFKDLDKYPLEEGSPLFVLKTTGLIDQYISTLDRYIDYGIRDPELFTAKVTELLFLLENSYDRQDLVAFFSLYLTDDYSFREQIRLNYLNVKTVRELACLMHYSYSGFNKRFKRVFGVSAYSWMQQQRARLIYRELLLSEKPLKAISLDYSFVSLSHFNEFCHKELGAAPSKIRKSSAMKSN